MGRRVAPREVLVLGRLCILCPCLALSHLLRGRSDAIQRWSDLWISVMPAAALRRRRPASLLVRSEESEEEGRKLAAGEHHPPHNHRFLSSFNVHLRLSFLRCSQVPQLQSDLPAVLLRSALHVSYSPRGEVRDRPRPRVWTVSSAGSCVCLSSRAYSSYLMAQRPHHQQLDG